MSQLIWTEKNILVICLLWEGWVVYLILSWALSAHKPIGLDPINRWNPDSQWIFQGPRVLTWAPKTMIVLITKALAFYRFSELPLPNTNLRQREKASKVDNLGFRRASWPPPQPPTTKDCKLSWMRRIDLQLPITDSARLVSLLPWRWNIG
jgi:hypothetical protein